MKINLIPAPQQTLRDVQPGERAHIDGRHILRLVAPKSMEAPEESRTAVVADLDTGTVLYLPLEQPLEAKAVLAKGVSDIHEGLFVLNQRLYLKVPERGVFSVCHPVEVLRDPLFVGLTVQTIRSLTVEVE